MTKRAVTCRFLTQSSDGRGKDGYYRRLAGLEVTSDSEDELPRRFGLHDGVDEENDHDSYQSCQLDDELDSDMSESEMEKMDVYRVERAVAKRRKVCSYSYS